jgi:hypothetical protein
MFLMDPSSSHLGTLWSGVVTAATAAGHFDAIFDDDADDLYDTSGPPCGDSAATWLAHNQTMISSLGYPVIYNGLALLGPGYTVSGSIGLNSVSMGGMIETCYSQAGSAPKIGPAVWLATENTEIAMAKQRKLLLCYSNNTSTASTSSDLRQFVYASYLMTYDPTTTVLWEYFGTPSGFHVQPESEIVPLYPSVQEPSDIWGLQIAGGVYGREYGACYVNGNNVGRCAAIVNPSLRTSYPYPYAAKYRHTLVISGGGVLDGGSISVLGSSPPSTVPPQGSLIVFQ